MAEFSEELSDNSDEEDCMQLLKMAIVASLVRRRQKRKRKTLRRVWVRPIYSMRRQQGDFHNLLQEVRLGDPESHFRYIRMSREKFDSLLQMVSPLLSHRGYISHLRPEISPSERLAVALRYLATGDSQISLSFSFRIGKSTVCSILQETCKAIWSVLKEEYVKPPSTVTEWERIANEFWQRWNFPNCVGAIDGKHIVVQAPQNSGSLYYNYKGTHSIVLMAVCDANYRFTLVDLGDVGRHSDGGVFSHSSFGEALENGSLVLPEPAPLPSVEGSSLPFVLVGDEAFPPKNYLLRPYPGQNLPDDQAIFNYRLSRARRIIENTFGILAARWRIFRRPVIAKPENVVFYTKGCNSST